MSKKNSETKTEKILELDENSSSNDISENNILQSLFDTNITDDKFKIINQLFSDENIESKTELNDVLSTSILQTLSEFLQDKQLIKSSILLKKFLATYMKFQLSYKRKSREEFVNIVSSLFKTENLVKNNNLSTIQQLNPIK